MPIIFNFLYLCPLRLKTMNFYDPLKKTIFLTLIFATMISLCHAQDSKSGNNKSSHQSKLIHEQAGRPDVPGDLIIEIGFNSLMNSPDQMNMKLWGSKIFNTYYLYDVPIGDSHFSFHPGFGIGTEKYAFADDVTLGYTTNTNNNREVTIVGLDSLYSNASFSKSKLATTYIDIPMEIRWISRKYDPKRSLKITIGGKIGYLIDSHTKVKYSQGGETKKAKSKQDFELNDIRYGAYGKLGYGNFSLFYYQSISDLFKKDKGPYQTDTSPIMFGISLGLF